MRQNYKYQQGQKYMKNSKSNLKIGTNNTFRNEKYKIEIHT